MYARIVKITRDRDAANDLLQDVFVRAYQHAPDIDEDWFGRYCMVVARHAALDYVQRQRRLEYREVDMVSESTPYDDLVSNERVQAYLPLRRAVAGLPEPQQEAVRAFLVYHNPNQAAHVLGIPRSTLGARQRAAFKQLRQALIRHNKKPLIAPNSNQ